MSLKLDNLKSTIKLFNYYKSLGEKSFDQIPEEKLFWQYNPDSNSIAMIVQHLSGNMLSRWTDFLTSDGEKSWRNRDAEFEVVISSKTELLEKWNAGWTCFLSALESLTESDLEKIIYIRNEGQTVQDAISRQLAHYPYHIGQIVFAAKMCTENGWKSLSVPKGKSTDYNQKKFSQEKQNKHFTDSI